MAFCARYNNDLLFHTSDVLEHEELLHGFSTRQGGVSEGCFASLNLRLGGTPADDLTRVEENYRRFCTAVGVTAESTVLSVQVHEDTVYPVRAEDAGKGLFRKRDYTADALVTNVPELSLMVFSADCGIFLLHDPVSHCIGAVHAGWRGTALGLPAKTVAEMGRLYGAKAENIRVAIGAGIGTCCFETDEDVPDAMYSAFGSGVDTFCHRHGRKWNVDLLGINRWRLQTAGIQETHLDAMDCCTACHPDLYWSHRKSGNARGVQGALIALKGAQR